MLRVRCSKSSLNICVLSLTLIKRKFWQTVGYDYVCSVQENSIQFMMWVPKYVVWIYNDLVIFTSIFCSFQLYKFLVPMLLAIFMMNMCNSLVHSVSGIYPPGIKWLRIETHFSDFYTEQLCEKKSLHLTWLTTMSVLCESILYLNFILYKVNTHHYSWASTKCSITAS